MSEIEEQARIGVEAPSMPVTEEVKIGRRNRVRPNTLVHGLRHHYPAIPVRGLWDQASEEERGRARENAATLIEYWTGQISRREAEIVLEVKPLRLWQLSQRAIAGMVAGLLTQPRRKKEIGAIMQNQDNPKKLKARIKELEKIVEAQSQLIAILRSMPGVREVGVGKEIGKGAGVQSGVQKALRPLVKKSKTGEP